MSEPRAPRSRLHEVLLSGRFAVTAELETTDGGDPAEVHEAAAPLVGAVDAVNCTDNSAAHPHISQVAAAKLLLDRGIEPIAQFTCRDRNRLALQADLLGAHALGVRNVLLMTGDDVTAGDHPEAKPIYDLDSIHLLRIARIMRDEGTYVSGRKLTSPPTFLIGAVENPFAPPVDYRPLRLAKKIEAGAEFVQTQICFNVERMREFMRQAVDSGAAEKAWILAGVYVPRSAAAARYLRDWVPGIDVPEETVRRLEGVPRDRQEEEGIRLAVEICREIREMPGVAGLHLMSIKVGRAVVRVVDELGLHPRPVTSTAARAPDGGTSS
ncbi:MAG: methylenetetrahydrofolate reductase [Actinobacteria bacterium]|nr:methylenetetrahydrofolate reductase [Actinomycetota bacterium]